MPVENDSEPDLIGATVPQTLIARSYTCVINEGSVLRRYAADLTTAMLNHKSATTEKAKKAAAREYGMISKCKVAYLNGKGVTFIKTAAPR